MVRVIEGFSVSGNTIVIALFCTFVIFLVNCLVPSQTNGFPRNGFNTSIQRVFQNDHAETVFWSRYQHSEFRRRPMVLEWQKFAKEKLGFPFQFSFNLINYLFLFLLFILMPVLSTQLGGNQEDSIYTQGLLLFSMPIIFAFFGSMCTYDDIVQYVLIMLFLIQLFNRKYLQSFVFFTLACVCRETSLVFYGFIAAFFFHQEGWRWNLLKQMSFWALALILYAGFILAYLPESLRMEGKSFLFSERFQFWQSNFGNFRYFRESTTILYVMSGIYILLLSGMYSGSSTRFWRLVGIGFIFINLMLVSTTALVREARLLFLPLLFVIPFCQQVIKQAFRALKKTWEKIELSQWIMYILVSVVLAFGWFTPQTKGTGYFYQAYVFVYSIIFFTWVFAGKRRIDQI